MLTSSIDLPFLPCLGHLARPARIRLLQDLCEAIRDDMRERGPDPHLLLLGAALDYCASLLQDAGEDPAGDAADAALARLEHELLYLMTALRAALHRPGDPLDQQAAARLLSALFPTGGMPDSLVSARMASRIGRSLEMERALNRLGLRPLLDQIDEALRDVDLSLERCRVAPASELQQRARAATRMADVILRRVVGHVISVTDPGDSEQRVRARALLWPLRERQVDSAAAGPGEQDQWAQRGAC
ncbi:MAG: hypothetical protein RMK29_11960 [Myxococcales bacterium]|nr:hypothetical protein [Myxococcota bacterium]MDW8282424.1 hypothetical protein [Myxococcales bacterium]